MTTPIYKPLTPPTRFAIAVLGLALAYLSPALAMNVCRAAETGIEALLVRELRTILTTEPALARIHAAESLLKFGYSQGVYDECIREYTTTDPHEAYQIGLMRVLSQAGKSPQERTAWTERLRQVFLDSAHPFRLHAIESLAKVNYTIRPTELAIYFEASRSADPAMAAFSRWLLAANGIDDGEDQFIHSMQSADDTARFCNAYVIRHLSNVSDRLRASVIDAAQAEKPGTLAFAYLNSASFVLAAPSDVEETTRCRKLLMQLAMSGNRDEAREACAAFAVRGTQIDAALLRGLLENGDPDIREAAAHALIRIGRRSQRHIGPYDWGVIGGYAVSMLLIGWLCSRYIVTTDDFLLGGRQMSPFPVALSLFATLISTLSYLALPGEMIKHGPMIAAEVLVYPLIAVIACYFFIPRFMRLPVTTAYELLENRLGVSARWLAALLFLTMRFLWMGLILFATTKLVLAPLLGWKDAAIPYLCALMCAITVIYSSLGGFRAVVITDAIQTLIMFLGGLATILIISFKLGGITAWWPTTWAATWDPPKVWFDPALRVTIMSASLSALTWHVCTAGSDQMAVQRYLAVRDVAAARRMFSLSLFVNFIAICLLSAIGIAVFAYFHAQPQMLADGQAITSNADELFPRFIVAGLPQGVTGLVIAALLAAAMSSLSSGISSTCSVLLVDIVDRFRQKTVNNVSEVRAARYISWAIGAIVVALSFLMTLVPGNLLEVTTKVVNLLVAPLFVLFFMAMFIPWASAWGTIVATLFSIGIGISVAFFRVFGLSFLWIMPSSLLGGILLAIILSLPNYIRLSATNFASTQER